MYRIMVLIGSDSDLPQCQKGLEILKAEADKGVVEVVGVYTGSIHRNTDKVLEWLRDISFTEPKVDCLITAAGWANHLTGTCDAYLRYRCRNSSTVVYGVALEDSADEQHTLAAKLSISEVPGTKVIFRDNDGCRLVGPAGFAEACQMACRSVKNNEVQKFVLSDPKPTQKRTIQEALDLIYGK